MCVNRLAFYPLKSTGITDIINCIWYISKSEFIETGGGKQHQVILEVADNKHQWFHKKRNFLILFAYYLGQVLKELITMSADVVLYTFITSFEHIYNICFCY